MLLLQKNLITPPKDAAWIFNYTLSDTKFSFLRKVNHVARSVDFSRCLQTSNWHHYLCYFAKNYVSRNWNFGPKL
jgi:LPS sulfotransferase NodH